MTAHVVTDDGGRRLARGCSACGASADFAVQQPECYPVHRNLKAGTVLRCGNSRILLKQDMDDLWAYAIAARKDGQPDGRFIGWSGSLRVADYTIESAPAGVTGERAGP